MCYRERIYQHYNKVFLGGLPGQGSKAIRWGCAYDWYLRGWLPTLSSTPILEAGCGAGMFLLFLQHRRYTWVTGVDISAEQVLAAREVTSDVHCADVVEWLRDRDCKWGLVVALDMIEHLHKDELIEFLELAYGHLVPGGRLIVQTPNASSPWGAMVRYGDFTHEVGLTPSCLTELMRLVGFEQIEAREVGPVPWGHSLASTVRYALWRLVRLGLLACDVIETGGKGEGVLTRVFLASANRPPLAAEARELP